MKHRANKKQIKYLWYLAISTWLFGFGYYLGSHRETTRLIVPTNCQIEYTRSKTAINERNTPTINKSERIVTPTPQKWVGKVSYYSRAGCLGCSPTLTMANGEPLDDTKLTIAFNKVKLNSRVRVTNLDNGKSVIATVTDTGGFERLGRLADLNVAVKESIEAKTDTSSIEITLLN